MTDVLDRLGWKGWRMGVPGPAGPCGTVSNLEGGGQHSFGGSLGATERRVYVLRGASRRLRTSCSPRTA